MNANAKPAAQETLPHLKPIIAARFQRFVLLIGVQTWFMFRKILSTLKPMDAGFVYMLGLQRFCSGERNQGPGHGLKSLPHVIGFGGLLGDRNVYGLLRI